MNKLNLSVCIRHEIDKVKNKSHRGAKLYKRFLGRIKDKTSLTHEKNPQSHLCCFSLPIDRRGQAVFLVHHIKADDWIPPGGHIDAGETPIQTVKRELAEELDYRVTHERIMIFDLSIASIRNPKYPCREHYDLWYAVETEKRPFLIDKNEFHAAGWFSYDKALSQIKTPLFREVIRRLLF